MEGLIECEGISIWSYRNLETRVHLSEPGYLPRYLEQRVFQSCLARRKDEKLKVMARDEGFALP